MRSSALGSFATRHGLVIAFLCVALCLAGAYAALGMPSSIFPQTNFPRVVILIDNGVMPANEMMATITRPVEEAMKDIPGVRTVRSKTGRGSAEINVFFTWQTDMVQAELFVQGRLAVVQKTLPATASSAVWRLTFAAFPVVGLSLTGPAHSLTELWETARYTIAAPLAAHTRRGPYRHCRRTGAGISRHCRSVTLASREFESQPKSPMHWSGTT